MVRRDIKRKLSASGYLIDYTLKRSSKGVIVERPTFDLFDIVQLLSYLKKGYFAPFKAVTQAKDSNQLS